MHYYFLFELVEAEFEDCEGDQSEGERKHFFRLSFSLFSKAFFKLSRCLKE